MNWVDEQYQHERRADILRDIAHAQMIRTLLANKRPRPCHPILVHAGKLFVRFGAYLQQRYGGVTEGTISVKGKKLPQN